jgi:hypothetical protein
MASLSLQWPRHVPESLHVGFVMDKVALGQVFSKFLRFYYPVNTIPPWLSTLTYHLQYEKRAI